ncbi:MAG TPA: hypothetical protein VH640_02075 [Bryobacteraceae bacterium]|jgi:hypothetical protein
MAIPRAPNGTVVEFDHSINAAVKRLRIVLGDSAQEPRYIETVGWRGYRFLLPVARAEGAHATPESEGLAPQRRRFRFESRFGVLLGLALGIAAVAWFVRSRGSPPVPLVPVELTSELGVAGEPSFSPDGNQVVYDQTSDAGQNHSLYVKIIGVPGPPCHHAQDSRASPAACGDSDGSPECARFSKMPA